MKRDLRYIKFGIPRLLIQGLHIQKHFLKAQACGPDLPMYEGVKDKGIVGTGGVAEGQRLSR